MDVADPRDARVSTLLYLLPQGVYRAKAVMPRPGEGGGVFTDMSVSPRPLALIRYRSTPLRAARIRSKDLHASPNGLTHADMTEGNIDPSEEATRLWGGDTHNTYTRKDR